MTKMKKLPPIGARIVKSAIAVALCMAIYYLRTLLPIGNGIPFYSALAALWCLQPYYQTTKTNAGQRSMGTFIGALFGFLFIVFIRTIGLQSQVPVYLLASAMIIPVIYLTVVLNKRNAAFFSCVVFLSIALPHSFDEDPYLFVFNRVLDTFIGISVGLGVNGFHLPRKHDAETLYVCGIDSVLIPEDHSAMQYSQAQLQGLARITVTDSDHEGYKYLKVFSPRASKQEMLKKLKEHTGIERTVTIGSIPGEYDIYIGDGGGNATVKKIRKMSGKGRRDIL